MRSGILLTIAALILGGCVSGPTYEYPYDPNEKIIVGVVGSKEIVHDPEAYLAAENEAAWRRNQVILDQAQAIGAGPAETIGAIIVLNMLGVEPPGGVTYQGNPMAYSVITQDKTEYKVLSYFPGFEKGQCVKLFVSNNPEKFPPRIASGSGCSNA